jgi:hypothetical protein
MTSIGEKSSPTFSIPFISPIPTSPFSTPHGIR